MKNPTTAILDSAILLRLEGQPWHEVLKETGLSHSQAERHEFRFKMWLWATDKALVDGDWSVIKLPADDVKAGQVIAKARAQGISWGVLGERCNTSESRVRKLFALATGTKSKGLRMGKGGRFAYDDEALYMDEIGVGTRRDGFSMSIEDKGRPPLPDLTPEQRKAIEERISARRAAKKQAIR